MAKRGAGCKVSTVRFSTKRGKVITFRGHKGGSCGPRPKPSTGHLRKYKAVMKAEAPGCKRRARGSAAVYRRCIGNAIKSATPR